MKKVFIDENGYVRFLDGPQKSNCCDCYRLHRHCNGLCIAFEITERIGGTKCIECNGRTMAELVEDKP